MSEPYDADYFLRGKETGKSLYENYRWMPDLTIPMVRRIIEYCGIRDIDTILDFGCARGYTVRALRELGYSARGYDLSDWAIDNCDPAVVNFVANEIIEQDDIDWIIAKDVLEHVRNVYDTIDDLIAMARVGIFVVVPLSLSYTAPYTVPEYEKDVTHIHRWPLDKWIRAFLRPGWSITAAYRVPGIKDNYAQWKMGNGFLTVRRVVD